MKKVNKRNKHNKTTAKEEPKAEVKQ